MLLNIKYDSTYSKDWHGKKWLLNFMCLITHLKLSFSPEKPGWNALIKIATLLNERKLICREFKNLKIHPYFICQPAARPTSDGSIGPVFSHNTEYQFVTTDLVFWLFIHCAIASPFILCYFFLFDRLIKSWEITKVVCTSCNGFYLLHCASDQILHECNYQQASH